MPDHDVLAADPESHLPHLATYRRVLPVSLERMFENALDWEHLPYVHAGSFSGIECVDAGSWGWRARVWSADGSESLLELRLDRSLRRWITRTLEGANVGSEVWTHAFPIERDRVDIVVDFFAPGVAADKRAKVGRAFAALYERLYDEDVAMMVSRQRHLDRRVEGSGSGEREVLLGHRADLSLPQRCSLAGRDFVVAESDGELVAFPALCPHQLGPLDEGILEGGTVRCPWHGYRFDVRSGECVSGQSCRLGQPPEVLERDGQVLVRSRA